MRSRRFLFLQGHSTPFYLRLGQALAQDGHGIDRINLCGGDRVFWGGWNARDYKGRPEALGAFVADTMARQGTTDLVAYNDCRPCNAAAIAEARRLNLGVHVFEEGYLRPNWVTLERDGINGNTRLPDDPAWYMETARRLPPFSLGKSVGSGMRERIQYDFKWQAANYLYKRSYPHYRTHRPYPIWAEYATWCIRLSTLKLREAQAKTVGDDLSKGGQPFYLFPLQLDSDSQIRVHSPFGRMAAAIQTVIENFARSAPDGSRLVVKNHPLDNGWINYRKLVGKLARQAGIEKRVLFIDGGDLNALVDHARGIVTVNSTVGLTALSRGAALIVLGKAVFDMPGLTFQGSLSDFWHAFSPPDPVLLHAYRKVVLHTCLVNGNFYTEQGMELAVANSVVRLTSDHDPLADAPRRRSWHSDQSVSLSS